MEGTVNKKLYKWELWLVKVIPVIMAGLSLASAILSYHYIDLIAISQFGGVSLLTFLFLCLSSFAFGFDVCHRIFIYYAIVNWLLSLYDYYVGIPLSNRNLYIMYLVIAVLSVLAYLYFRQKKRSVNEVYLSIDEECSNANLKKAENGSCGNKRIYRYELLSIKLIPIIIVGIMVLNTTLSYFGIDWAIFSHLAGVSFLSILLMYISSIVFRFCAYHRIFIHYITFVWLINIIDWYTDVLRNHFSIDVILLALIASGITIFLAIILKIKKI